MLKMATYSNSKLSTYESCPYQYKLRYIDKIEVEVPTTIEMFLGDLVHRTMEKLYTDLKYQKMNSKEDLLVFYNDMWKSEPVPFVWTESSSSLGVKSF